MKVDREEFLRATLLLGALTAPGCVVYSRPYDQRAYVPANGAYVQGGYVAAQPVVVQQQPVVVQPTYVAPANEAAYVAPANEGGYVAPAGEGYVAPARE